MTEPVLEEEVSPSHGPLQLRPTLPDQTPAAGCGDAWGEVTSVSCSRTGMEKLQLAFQKLLVFGKT